MMNRGQLITPQLMDSFWTFYNNRIGKKKIKEKQVEQPQDNGNFTKRLER